MQNPIDLFNGSADTDAIIKTVHILEKQYGQKGQLIIGDTLARLSAGANESAGQDMGLVIRHVDRIRNESNAHFLLIHHCGKNAAAGARGWSGVRAAMDTEIEVTDSSTGRCAEITKQRDLSTKGVSLGFRLDPVTLGKTKWGSPATSCIVLPANAPSKKSSVRPSKIRDAVENYLSTSLVKHFEGTYKSGAIYRVIKKLVKTGIANECRGWVSVLNQSGEPNITRVPISAN